MQRGDWVGVLPAITTPFDENGRVDISSLSEHVSWLLETGCKGIVALGSLGEGATLSAEEKREVLRACGDVMRPDTYLIAGIAGMGTDECVSLAKDARAIGCDGLMVLPPYLYRGDWRETRTHFEAVIRATDLSCMLYNNPAAYGTDLDASQIAELSREENVHAVKESSGDARRLAAIRGEIGDRLDLLVGLDDMVVEGVRMGARGWVAGLVNALPEESVRLFDLALAGDEIGTRELYEWFLPLLRFDTGPRFVQLIKLVQSRLHRGDERVRPPRLALVGDERNAALALIDDRMKKRAELSSMRGSGSPTR